MQYPLFSDLPDLSVDECDDARFRGKDMAWSALAGLFDSIAENDATLTYQALGDRIGKSRSQVQRWLDMPHNVTLQSVALLAEGMDAELIIRVARRRILELTNNCHPADEAKANMGLLLYEEGQKSKSPPGNSTTSVRGWGF